MIHESPHYLRTIVDNLNDMIVVFNVEPNLKFRIVYVNPAFTESAGYQDVIGKELFDVVGPDKYEYLLNYYQEVLNTKNIVEWQYDFEVPTGKKLYLTKFVPVLNPLGECKQIIGITRDLS